MTSSASGASNERAPLNWTAITGLYAAVLLGIVWMLYWGDFRNAAWLALIALGGALTAYGRVLENRGRERAAQRWKWGATVVYLIFFVWAGSVFFGIWSVG